VRAGIQAFVRAGVLVALLLAATAGVFALLPLRADLTVLLPDQQSEDLAIMNQALRAGPAGRTVLIGLSPADGKATPKRLATLSRAYKAALMETGHYAHVVNGSFALDAEALQPFRDYRYRLNPPLDPDAYTAQGLAKKLEELLLELRGLGSPVIEDLMADDPTLRTLEVARLWRDSGGPERANGVWVGQDGGRAVLIALSKAEGFDVAAQRAVVAALHDAARTVEAEHGAVEMDLGGPPVITVKGRETVNAETARLLALSLPVVAFVLLATFRRLSVGLAAAVPLIAGFGAGAGAVAAAFGTVHVTTLGFGATLVGVTVDYPLHLFGHQRDRTGPWATAARIWPALRLGVLTTAIGFVPLVFSSFPGVAQLGLFTLVALLVAALVTRYALPWTASPIRLPEASGFWHRFQPLHHQLAILRWPALVLGLVCLTVLTVKGDQIWDADLEAVSPTPKEMKQRDKALRADLAATNPRFLVVIAGADDQEVLARGEKLLATLRDLREQGVLAGFDTLARYLPSAATQAERLAALPDRAELETRLAEARQGLPFEAGTFAPFVDDLAAAKRAGPVAPDDLDHPALRSRVANLLVGTEDGARGFAFIRGLRDPERLDAALAATQVPGVRLLDLKEETEALLRGYRTETLTWIALGGVLAALALLLGLRKPRAVALVAGAVGVSVVTTAAVLVLAGTTLTVFHLLGLMVVAGLGLDYAIFLREAAEAEYPREADTSAHGADDGLDARRSVVVCAITSTAVFAILAGAEFPMLAQLGTTVAIGAALSLVFGLVFTGRESGMVLEKAASGLKRAAGSAS
jgi:predicted exporter